MNQNSSKSNYPEVIKQFLVKQKPHYVEINNEREIFDGAFGQKMPLLLKGPTGCGKTRFIENMAYLHNLPLITISCHEDLVAADLVGRYLFKNNQTEWDDGPLTLAVKYGGICYLDEIVEARNDTTVIIHSLTDHRRLLYIDKIQKVYKASDKFMMVISYNPGYQNITKELKESTKQRFCGLTFNYPEPALESKIIAAEAGVSSHIAESLAKLGVKIRNLKGFGLNEGISTRLLIYAGQLTTSGISPREACRAAITDIITDDQEIIGSVNDIINLYFPE
jgi:nitric oxide reductase NorQ protein